MSNKISQNLHLKGPVVGSLPGRNTKHLNVFSSRRKKKTAQSNPTQFARLTYISTPRVAFQVRESNMIGIIASV